MVKLFNRWSAKKLFSQAKEWLMLDDLRVLRLEQAGINAVLSFTDMLVVALTAIGSR